MIPRRPPRRLAADRQSAAVLSGLAGRGVSRTQTWHIFYLDLQISFVLNSMFRRTGPAKGRKPGVGRMGRISLSSVVVAKLLCGFAGYRVPIAISDHLPARQLLASQHMSGKRSFGFVFNLLPKPFIAKSGLRMVCHAQPPPNFRAAGYESLSMLSRKMSTNQEKPHKLVVLKATADKGPLDSAWAFLDSEDIPSMSVADLTEALKERGLDSSGSKKVCPAAAASGSNQPAHQYSIPDKQR